MLEAKERVLTEQTSRDRDYISARERELNILKEQLSSKESQLFEELRKKSRKSGI